jgi:hypothetical protein
MNPAKEVMKQSEQVSQIALNYLSWAAKNLVGTISKEDAEQQPLSFEEMGSRLREALRVLQGEGGPSTEAQSESSEG